MCRASVGGSHQSAIGEIDRFDRYHCPVIESERPGRKLAEAFSSPGLAASLSKLAGITLASPAFTSPGLAASLSKLAGVALASSAFDAKLPKVAGITLASPAFTSPGLAA